MNTQSSIKLFETKRVGTACISDYLGTNCPQVEIRKRYPVISPKLSFGNFWCRTVETHGPCVSTPERAKGIFRPECVICIDCDEVYTPFHPGFRRFLEEINT